MVVIFAIQTKGVKCTHVVQNVWNSCLVELTGVAIRNCRVSNYMPYARKYRNSM